EWLKLEVRSPAELVRQGGQAMLDGAADSAFFREVVDDEDVAVRLANPLHLRHQPVGMRHYRGDIHRGDRIEGVVLEGELLRTHVEQRLDVAELLLPRALAGLAQHVVGNIDAGNAEVLPVARQREPGSNANLKNPPLGGLIDQLYGTDATRVQQHAEDDVVNGCLAPVSGDDRLLVDLGERAPDYILQST